MIAKNGTRKLARQASEVKKYRMLQRMIPALMAVIAVLVTLVYVVSVMYMKFGSFTVSINKYHALKYGLSLSETEKFEKPIARLNCKASEDITNISGSALEGIDFGAVDGNDSGENYLCYTFYCKNTGEDVVSFEYSINIENMTMGVEKAVRIRLIRNINRENKQSTDYARAANVDENGNAVPEPGTVAFYNKYTVMQEKVENFNKDDVMKFTIVIWLEGDDPECLDNIIGGIFKIDMKFTVTAVAGVEVGLENTDFPEIPDLLTLSVKKHEQY